MVLIGVYPMRKEYSACSMAIDQLRRFSLLIVQVCLHPLIQRRFFESNSIFRLTLTSILHFGWVIQVDSKLCFLSVNKD